MPIRTRLHRLELRLAPSQQDMWVALRERGTLTTAELSDRADDIRAAWTYLRRLVKAGIAERVQVRRGQPLTVRLVRDEGPIAPRLTDGGRPSRRGLLIDQMWRTIRMHRRVDRRELAIYASTEDVTVSPQIAAQYLEALCRAGYLREVEPGRQHKAAAYLLIPSKNTGPRPPRVIHLRGVYDDNLGAFAHAEEARGG
jgi:hypothetical protein